LQRHTQEREAVRRSEARQTHLLKDLILWQRKLRGTEFAVRSAATSRPNPLALDSLLVASIWSPGAIVALDRETGRSVWRRPMLPLAHDTVCHADRVLYTHALHTLHALEAGSGRLLWSWQPVAGEETLYASPTVGDGRVFIGDRLGRFWCLDARTGQPTWSHQPSPDPTGPITTTATLHRGLVTMATSDALVVAYEAKTGREAWRQRLDGPAGGDLFVHRGQLALRTFWSVYLLEPKDGSIAERWHWRGRYTRHLVGSRDTLLAVTQRAYGNMSAMPAAVLRSGVGHDSDPTLIGLSREGELFRRPCARELLGLRWSPESGLVYEARTDGLGIIDPRSGELLHNIVSRTNHGTAHCGLVDVQDGTIYMLSLRGVVRALRHPERVRSRRSIP
jgi:outer membrane protein assembly factor BamB